MLDDLVSGEDISEFPLFEDSSILPLKEQYANEARFVFSDTASYQEFNRTLEALSHEEQNKLYSEMEGIFRQLASCIDQAPGSEEVQRLIGEWQRILGQFMTCDVELLACIAGVYKSDGRFRNYFAKYGHEDFADFLYEAIMHNLGQSVQ